MPTSLYIRLCSDAKSEFLISKEHIRKLCYEPYTVKKTSKKSCEILQTSKRPTAMIKELAAVFLTVYRDKLFNLINYNLLIKS